MAVDTTSTTARPAGIRGKTRVGKDDLQQGGLLKCLSDRATTAREVRENPFFKDTRLEPLLDQADHARVADPVVQELD